MNYQDIPNTPESARSEITNLLSKLFDYKSLLKQTVQELEEAYRPYQDLKNKYDRIDSEIKTTRLQLLKLVERLVE